MTHIANGVHVGLHWYLQRCVGYPGPLVTVDGFDGAAYVHATEELAEPTNEAITALVEHVLADSRARRAKRAGAAPVERAPVTEPESPIERGTVEPQQGVLL